MHLLARLDGWTEDTWRHERDAAIVRYLSPAHETAAARGEAVLDDEISRWGQVDDSSAVSHGPVPAQVTTT